MPGGRRRRSAQLKVQVEGSVMSEGTFAGRIGSAGSESYPIEVVVPTSLTCWLLVQCAAGRSIERLSSLH